MKKLILSTSPHLHTKVSTQSIMRDVLIALCPAVIASVVLFGLDAFLVLLVCVASCVLSELVFNIIAKKEQTVGDLSAAVTGVLLGLSLPAYAELWQCAIGGVFAIVVVKCLFGGIGSNFANPAVTARVFLLLAFTSMGGGAITNFMPELIGGATPLEILKTSDHWALPSLFDMFIGNRAGAIGETCAIAIILGYIYLVARRVIKWYVPASYVGGVFLLTLIIEGSATTALYHVLAGGLLLAAVFMATDYVTTPINSLGKVVFAFGCAVITVLIRLFGSYPGGVSFAILIMNILSPYIEKLCAKRAFGGKKNEK